MGVGHHLCLYVAESSRIRLKSTLELLLQFECVFKLKTTFKLHAQHYMSV
ncbi:hypothetical protein F442_10184 [Phytophthora nicotianae P10297]|uniref:Uncharacterized protein n=2 Tax=Phytophthora nicotianae TaxID=4792 RepID=V9F0J7_PHYNI|nr:hypothetical protein F443_10280 [Phytophthora nicotianae P1569]ETP42945.1 hypothetical protein F442_10184 [Phytophthora nicotianae P10297]